MPLGIRGVSKNISYDDKYEIDPLFITKEREAINNLFNLSLN